MTQYSLIVGTGPWDPAPWRKAFQGLDGGRHVHFWPQDGDAAVSAPYVICSWKAEAEVFRKYAAPRAVLSLGAGVDFLVGKGIPPSIPVARIVDEDLTTRMIEYVTFAVLHLHRQMWRYAEQQRRGEWRPCFQPAATGVGVSILGVGVLGTACGNILKAIGYNVTGWARDDRPRPGLTFPLVIGRDMLDGTLAASDILVSLLPNTAETRGFVSRDLFTRLRRTAAVGGPYFVSAGRGETVSENDLVACLGDGTLRGAVLDVFAHEPLAPAHPLWSTPNVLITPHIAADSDPEVCASQILRSIERLERGDALVNLVDLARGY